MGFINEERGEFEIELGGATYGMRPSFEAISAFEKATGRSLLQLASDAERQALSIEACAAIVTECVKAWGASEKHPSAGAFSAKKIGPLLMGGPGGILFIQGRLQLMLFMAATGGVDAKGGVKAQATAPSAEVMTADADASAESPAPL